VHPPAGFSRGGLAGVGKEPAGGAPGRSSLQSIFFFFFLLVLSLFLL